ncbi:hypothetical protein MOO46_06100 [Apilactobacillus apisilvae]|uniref:Uncharacterized protein n=1 Tax=Apilactobacillus apisilvae TaxID=2923364 RepID=A0ABY4PG97_9LACO|nr:hypothetical protein [Apilactobacillus apisilvae]UQS84815.1 hypothetical protein MOO46_06100 [Apilactobacillus apisilvae]
MKKININQYTFYYENTMIYFYDQRYNNILFMNRLNDDNESINEYDGPQLIIQFTDESVFFKPIWNVNIEQINEYKYIITKKFN